MPFRLFLYANFISLDMLAPLDPKRDLRLSGQVIYTGSSSMEVAVQMESIGNDQPEQTVLLGISFMLHRLLFKTHVFT